MDPVTIAVSSALAGKASQEVIRRVAVWLTEQAVELAPAATAVVGSSGEAVNVFARWLADKLGGQADTDLNLASLIDVPLENAAGLLATLTAAERISGNSPGRMIRDGIQPGDNEDKRLQLIKTDRRVGLGLTRVGDIPTPVLLLSNAAEHRVGDNSAFPGVTSIVVGQAVAELAPTAPPELQVPEGEHRPGRSVAHKDYFAGTIGAYVNYLDPKTNKEIKGFVSASHVLTAMGKATKRNENLVFSPGPPDRERNGIYEYGELVDWRGLVHYTEQGAPDIIINDVDIALASLLDATVPARNVVPNPARPGQLLEVVDAMTLVEIRDHTLSDVFMFGRTSGLSHGRLQVTDIREFPIKMPNGRNYMYGGLAMIETAVAGKRFSQGGDSGAMVYVVENNVCRALGFIVGGSDAHTLVCPAITSLSAVKASLV